jgi:hypothetical protein
MASFSVPLQDAQNFQKVWTKNGLAVLLPADAALFAKDFADICLRNFIQMCQQQQAQQQIVEKKKQILIEGI